MSNELLWVLFALVNFSLVTLSYKLFGKSGLFAWIAVGSFIANIQVLKNVELFGLVATLGNVMYGTLFLVTDALGEKYGKKEAKKAVYIGFFILLSSTIIMQLAIAFTPLAGDDGWAQGPLESLFLVSFSRIVFASLIAYLLSQLLDVYLFSKIKERLQSDKYLWVRNNGSTLLSQLVDTSIFVPIAFLGVMDNAIVLDIFITTYIIKVMVAVLDTPFVYLIKKIKPINL